MKDFFKEVPIGLNPEKCVNVKVNPNLEKLKSIIFNVLELEETRRCPPEFSRFR